MQQRPGIAVVGPNVLVGIGMKAILEKIIPMAEVGVYTDFDSFFEAGPDRFFHFFVATGCYAEHAAFFRGQRHKTILLTDGRTRSAYAGMHTLDLFTSEEQLVRDLLHMHHGAHPHEHMPAAPPRHDAALLTDRETEVLTLVARGFINKQIADRLGIGTTTVITHRRNIMEKLGLRSVAELTLYAVTAGYIDAERI